MALSFTDLRWGMILIFAQIILPAAGGCIPEPNGGLATPEEGKVSWEGCYNCPPQDFTTEIHILREMSGGLFKHTTVNLVRQARSPSVSLTLILVSVEPVDWLVILRDKRIRISRLYLIAASPAKSEAVVLGQEIPPIKVQLNDPLMPLRGILGLLAIGSSYITSYAITTTSGEWTLLVGITGPESMCAGGATTVLDQGADSEATEGAALSFKRGIIIGGFSLITIVVICLVWWWRLRRAKGNSPSPARETTSRRSAVSRRERSTTEQVEAPGPPVYTPYDPPPPYEEFPPGGVVPPPLEDNNGELPSGGVPSPPMAGTGATTEPPPYVAPPDSLPLQSESSPTSSEESGLT